MAKNLITGYDIATDECGQKYNKYAPSLKTASINKERLSEIQFNHNNKVVKNMY